MIVHDTSDFGIPTCNVHHENLESSTGLTTHLPTGLVPELLPPRIGYRRDTSRVEAVVEITAVERKDCPKLLQPWYHLVGGKEGEAKKKKVSLENCVREDGR